MTKKSAVEPPVFRKYGRGFGPSTPQESLERILSEASSVQWIPSGAIPIDQAEHYTRQMTGRGSKIQTFKPSPASNQVLMTARFSANALGQQTIVGKAWHVLSDAGLRLMSDLPANQIVHRSRPAGLMSYRLEVNELNRRILKGRTNLPSLRMLSLPTSVSEEILSIKRSAVLSRMKWSDDTWRKYVSEHKLSSVIPGVKWSELEDVDEQFKREWLDMHREAYEDHILTNQQWDTPFNLGGRQRNSADVHPHQVNYDLVEDRTRIVNFHLPASTLYSVIPDKTGMMREIFTNVLDLFDISSQVMFPPVHGGEVYGAAREALNHGENLVIVLGDDLNVYQDGVQLAYDGVNWETQVGTLMGDANRGTKTYFGGMWHLPSGVWDTTIDGSIASLSVFSQLESEIRAGTNVEGIMEREEEDEAVNFMLGLRYVDDPDYPRLQGLKLTVDKPQGSETLPRGRTIELTNKYDPEEVLRWELGYHGVTQDGDSLLSFLETVKPEDFRAGSEQILGYVQKGEV